MDGHPILWRTSIRGVLLTALCIAAPAQADVLEISDDGATWIAGGPVQIPDTVQALC